MARRHARLLSFLIFVTFASSSALADDLQFEQGPASQDFFYRVRTKTKTNVLNLVDYIRQHVVRDSLGDIEARVPRYNRREDFGGWIAQDPSGGCLDTRGTVLVRSADLSTKIGYRDTSKCLVTKGLWHDPYTGTDFKLAKSVQIDHVVPLKHAYLTGAWNWAPERRCHYANFINNRFHLLAVSGHENMSKSDAGPERYLPPDESFRCEYVSTWMKVKAIWEMVSTAPELATIEKVIRDHRCANSKLTFTQAELAKERAAIGELPRACIEFARIEMAN